MASTKTATVEPCGPVDASIRPPGSKSLTNRAVVCAALASGQSQLSGVLNSDDTQVMISAWQSLGLKIDQDLESRQLWISGCGGSLSSRQKEIFVGNSGTTVRFLTAALAACEGQFLLDGVQRMRERPIGDLLDALEQLGACFERRNPQRDDCPPILVQARGLNGGRVVIRGDTSSQFLSALMMASPLASSDVEIQLEGELVSVPYVKMTAEVMRSFGAEVLEDRQETNFKISAQQKYEACHYEIEPDASAASYFWAAAAITGGTATVLGLSKRSLQGDVGFCEVLEQMGCRVEYGNDWIRVSGGTLRGIDVNMADISDTVQSLAAVAVFAEGPTRIRGVEHNRVKETDRISDLARELRKLGCRVDESRDGLSIVPSLQIQPARIKTYDDHRMAMSLALVGLRQSGIEIEDPACTAKTYPEFWKDLQLFCGSRITWRD